MLTRKKKRNKKRRFFRNFKPGHWLGLGAVKHHAGFLRGLVTDNFKDNADEEEVNSILSFAEVVKKYSLTENGLVKLANRSYFLSAFFFIISFFIFIYAGYLIYLGFVLSSFCTFSISFLLFSYGIKECLFYSRIKLKKLDVGVKEGFKCLLSIGGK